MGTDRLQIEDCLNRIFTQGGSRDLGVKFVESDGCEQIIGFFGIEI